VKVRPDERMLFGAELTESFRLLSLTPSPQTYRSTGRMARRRKDVEGNEWGAAIGCPRDRDAQF